MEPNSLSFLTYNEINEIQSYMVGGFRAVRVLGVFVFKTTKLRVLLSKVQMLAGVISITTGP